MPIMDGLAVASGQRVVPEDLVRMPAWVDGRRVLSDGDGEPCRLAEYAQRPQGDSLGLQSDTEGEADVRLAISSVFDVYDWHDVRWKDVVAGFMVEAQRLVGRDDGQHDASVVVCRPVKNMADQVEDKRLEGISDIRDESDRNGMRVVIELKRDANPQVVLNRLFAQTQLQTTFAINMLALVQSGGQPQPKILSLRHILDEYIAFQEEVIVRRTRYDLRKAQERAHLLEGLLIAEDNIDAVIQTIRESYDDAKENLMNRFGLSDVQAQAILDMQLKRLQGLEKEKLQNEYKELEARIAYFNELLSSEEKIRGVLKDELTAIRDRYGDDRVTEIQDVEDEIDIEDLIEEEECVFTLTAGGYIKRTAASTYKAQRRGGKGITAMSTKEEDYVDTVFTASTHDFILFFTNKGRVHRKKGYQIPEAGRTARGTNLVNVLPIEQDEKVTAMIHLREFPEDRYLVMVTRSGTVKRIQLSSIYTARKAGIRCITLDEGDELICVRETDGDQAILIVTHDGMAICFKETDVRCMGRDAAGLRGHQPAPRRLRVGAARGQAGPPGVDDHRKRLRQAHPG